MHAVRPAHLFFAALLFSACGPKPVSVEEYHSEKLTFPNGVTIRVERLVHQTDIVTGMQYRDSLAENHGLLFVFAQEATMPFWMYRVKVPLDMLWLDRNRTILEIVPNVPPCSATRDKCPTYGGSKPSMYVLELAAGVAAKNHLQPGMQLDF